MKIKYRLTGVVLASFCMLLFLTTACFAQLSDISGHWAENMINKWHEKGLVKGYEDGSFGPDSYISRAEFVTIVNRAFAFEEVAGNDFTDVKSDAWYSQEVGKAMAADYIKGYGDGTFKPESYISRQEAAAVVARILKLNLAGSLDAAGNLTDLEAAPDWSRAAIKAVVANRIMNGYPDNTFRPAAFITRAEVIAIFENVSGKTVISSMVTVTNGTIEIKLGDNLTGLTAGDLEITARLDGKPVSLSNLKFDPEKQRFTFTPISQSSASQVLEITVSAAAGSERVVGSETAKVTIPAVIWGGGSGSHRSSEGAPTASAVVIAGTAEVGETLTGNYSYHDNDGDLEGVSLFRWYRAGDRDDTEKTVIEGAYGKTYTVSADDADQFIFFEVTPVALTGGANYLTGTPVISEPVQISRPNTPPTTPVITRTPAAGNVSVNDVVYITAYSADAEGDAINYVWTGRLGESSTYPAGRHVITVKAIDEHGAESQPAATVFFALDIANGQGGMLLTDPESRIYENGIDGATISSYSFNVPSVSGHYGNDYAWVKGLNITNQQWEQIDYQTVSNGVYMYGNLSPGTYSRLEFFYYASHCMYGKSNITYTVDFVFGNIPPGVPAEAAPAASNVNITGTADLGETLTGNYSYQDDNGDLEGTSEFQWYLADDAVGSNKMAITGATSQNYTITAADAGKYIFFEVKPVALTGVTGTLEGHPEQSQPVQVSALSNTPPTAANVEITGTAGVGETLIGNYIYSDAEGDAEGISTFQWYQADDAAGTNLTAIAGATGQNYTITAADAGKYIFFEVKPVALTGITGALEGTPKQSQPVQVSALPNLPPTAANVEITGTAGVGETLIGNYIYSDAEGDAEGISTFQWYQADDAAGTNLTAIAGATGNTYTLVAADENKFIFFEVTPVADTGTQSGTPVLSGATAQVSATPV